MTKNKVRFINKKSSFIDKSVQFGKNVTIYPNNIILGNSVIGDNVVLKPNNYIQNSTIESNCVIDNSHIVLAYIKESCAVGPFTRIRAGSLICEHVKLGNFVEIKNSTIGKGTKAGHLAYIGDAEVGENCNIGCGVIFCNYNGKNKFKSTVGNGCFIGSNVNIIAPISIANNTFICAGTTVTKSTNCNDFVIGRSREIIKENGAEKYIDTNKGD